MSCRRRHLQCSIEVQLDVFAPPKKNVYDEEEDENDDDDDDDESRLSKLTNSRRRV